MTPPALLAEGVRLSFPDGRGGRVEVLAIDRLALPPGGRICLTGPSGSGKSTLLHVLSGLLVPEAGRVMADATDLAQLGASARDAWRRRTVGMVFQDFHLLPELTPLENVLLPVSFGAFRTPPAAVARARALLARLGAPTARARAGDLSRGEQQRVALARALMLDPPVILADEPTANLDAEAARTVAELLDALAAEGRSLLVVSHDPALIGRLGGEVRLEHGRIREVP
jgi:putative ABC transport system ATP-binding protein